MVFGINSKDIIWKSTPEHNIDIPHRKQMAVPLGTRYEDIFGNEYMYVQFAEFSLSAGDPVTLFGGGTMPPPADIIPTTAKRSIYDVNGYAIRDVPEVGMFGLVILERPVKQMDISVNRKATKATKATADPNADCFFPIGIEVPYKYNYGLIKHNNWASASSSFAGKPIVYSGFQTPLITPEHSFIQCYYTCQMRLSIDQVITIPSKTFVPCVKVVDLKDTEGADRMIENVNSENDVYCGYARVDAVSATYTYGIAFRDGAFGIYDGDDRLIPPGGYMVIVLDYNRFLIERVPTE